MAPEYMPAHNSRGMALTRLGALQARLGQHEQGAESYGRAVAAYDKALGLAPDATEIPQERERALHLLEEVQRRMGE